MSGDIQVVTIWKEAWNPPQQNHTPAPICQQCHGREPSSNLSKEDPGSGPTQMAAADSRLMEYSRYFTWPKETQAVHKHPFLSLHRFHSLSTPADARQTHSGSHQRCSPLPHSMHRPSGGGGGDPCLPTPTLLSQVTLKHSSFRLSFSAIQSVHIREGIGGGGY